MPHRIELPGYLNVPPRRRDLDPVPLEERTLCVRKLQDLELLVFACHRAGKLREEGRAYFALGVLRDNLGDHKKAVGCYQHFLSICEECKDGQGVALANHCMAVDYQLMGSDTHTTKSLRTSRAQDGVPLVPAPKAELLKKAIQLHTKHREIADTVGKFVAHLNMGLAYALLGQREAATVNHQYALRYALELHSLEGQSLAIGSIGFVSGLFQKESVKLRALMERYVELCGELKQPKNHAAALRKLGIIAGQQGDTDQSMDYFKQAIKAARSRGDGEAETDCSVRLGIAAGQARMAEHISSILQDSLIGFS